MIDSCTHGRKYNSVIYSIIFFTLGNIQIKASPFIINVSMHSCTNFSIIQCCFLDLVLFSLYILSDPLLWLLLTFICYLFQNLYNQLKSLSWTLYMQVQLLIKYIHLDVSQTSTGTSNSCQELNSNLCYQISSVFPGISKWQNYLLSHPSQNLGIILNKIFSAML